MFLQTIIQNLQVFFFLLSTRFLLFSQHGKILKILVLILSFLFFYFRIATLTVERNFSPWHHPDFIYFKTKKGREYQKNLDIVQGFTKKVIQERQQERKNQKKNFKTSNEDFGIKKRQAFLDLLLDASENDQSAKLTDVEIREEVDTFMFEVNILQKNYRTLKTLFLKKNEIF